MWGPWSEPWSGGLGIKNPWAVCASMFLCVCVYVCLYVSLCVLLCLWLAMHVYMCLCVCVYVSACVFPCVCVSVCVIVGGVYVCVTICLRIHLWVSACVHVQMWNIPWADPQRERLTSPCGHTSRMLGPMVPSWVLPGSRIYPPHQTSPHCPVACSCRERTEGQSLEDDSNSTVWKLWFSIHQGPKKFLIDRCRNQG